MSKQEFFSKKEIYLYGRDLFFIVFFIIILIKYIIWPSEIIGNSMDNNFYEKEFILVNRVSALNLPFIGKVNDYKRGDVIVFDSGVFKEKRFLIKRIIGLGGEKIKIKDGKVYIKKKNKKEFEILKEDYLSVLNKDNTFVDGTKQEFIFNIPKDSFFVMGDNRMHSTDSRQCFEDCRLYEKHFVKKDEIIGKVWMDLGYFDYKKFKFIHPETQKNTSPRFFNFPKNWNYEK